MKPQQPKAAPTNNQTTDQAIDEQLDQLQVKSKWSAPKPFTADKKIYYITGKKQAKAALSQLLANEVRKAETRAEIATVKLILSTCKYEGRELYLSTTAVEMLLTDLELQNDRRKALTALNRIIKQLKEETTNE